MYQRKFSRRNDKDTGLGLTIIGQYIYLALSISHKSGQINIGVY